LEGHSLSDQVDHFQREQCYQVFSCDVSRQSRTAQTW